MSRPGWLVLPTRHEALDSVALVALTTVALAGFRSAYGGWTFLIVGIIAAVLGTAIAHLSARFRLPALPALLVGLIGLIVFGASVAIRDHVVLGAIPEPGALTGFVDGLISGWKRLLTTLPPSGSLGNLLSIAFFCAFVTTWATTFLARRPGPQMSLLVLPGVVLAGSVLFGTREPFSIVLQGAVAAALAIAWLALRRARTQQHLIGSNGGRRTVGAVGMLTVTAMLGLVLGPALPFAASADRYVLRDQNEPPFDPRDYGSPLNGFQRYLVGSWRDEILLTVDELPPPDEGDRSVYLRLAVMDDYDGVVWRVSPRSGTQGGRFIRVGESIPTDSIGERATIDVTVESLRGAWMPAAGVIAGVRWLTDDNRVTEQQDLFRLSTVTSTGVLPSATGWQPGDRYQLDIVIPPVLSDADVTGQGPNRQTVVEITPAVPEQLRTLANVVTKGEASPLEQAKALEQFFRNGYYASGDDELDETNPPGHSYARLIAFVGEGQPIGNAEQYAAAMAVMARSLDLPARVIMGFRLDPEATEVRGEDVHAWVEIGFADGWKRFEPTSERREKPEVRSTQARPVFESQDLPPPPVIPPEPEVNARQGDAAKRDDARKPDDEDDEEDVGTSIVLLAATIGAGVPSMSLAAFATVVLGLKRRRRNRRRRSPDPSSQVAGGWAEYVDTARDIGAPVPARATRRETALLIGAERSYELAERADGAVFASLDPDIEHIDSYWSDLELALRELRRPLPLRRRISSRLSLTSLRREPEHRPNTKQGKRAPS